MAEFTPKPWVLEIERDEEGYVTAARIEAPNVSAQVGWVMVENIDAAPGSEEEKQILGDGNLFAAAPDMLDALQLFVNSVRAQFCRPGSDVVHIVPGMRVFLPYEAAVAAIAKAKGESDKVRRPDIAGLSG